VPQGTCVPFPSSSRCSCTPLGRLSSCTQNSVLWQLCQPWNPMPLASHPLSTSQWETEAGGTGSSFRKLTGRGSGPLRHLLLLARAPATRPELGLEVPTPGLCTMGHYQVRPGVNSTLNCREGGCQRGMGLRIGLCLGHSWE
jgi:hypothetical protein